MNCPKCNNPGQEPGKPCDNCGFAIPLGHDGETIVLEGMAFAGESLGAGERIGNYEVIRELGRGGMGVVYHVRHDLTGAECALKIIRPELSSDEQYRNRFLFEAEIARGLSHCNIVRVDRPITDGDLFYFTMDLVPGKDLGKLIEESKVQRDSALPLISLHEACNILAPMLDALAYAHGRETPVIHCDLKPKNVMVSGEFPNVRVTVLDFGFARMLSADSRSSMVKAEGGDPVYMAPEQWREEPVSSATDLFPVGVMLCEMLMGVIPRGLFKLPGEVFADIPSSLDDWLRGCLQNDPAERFDSAFELRQSLVAIREEAETGRVRQEKEKWERLEREERQRRKGEEQEREHLEQERLERHRQEQERKGREEQERLAREQQGHEGAERKELQEAQHRELPEQQERLQRVSDKGSGQRKRTILALVLGGILLAVVAVAVVSISPSGYVERDEQVKGIKKQTYVITAKAVGEPNNDVHSQSERNTSAIIAATINSFRNLMELQYGVIISSSATVEKGSLKKNYVVSKIERKIGEIELKSKVVTENQKEKVVYSLDEIVLQVKNVKFESLNKKLKTKNTQKDFEILCQHLAKNSIDIVKTNHMANGAAEVVLGLVGQPLN